MLSPSRLRFVILSALLAYGASAPHQLFARQSRVANERQPGPIVDFIATLADGTPAANLQPSEVEIRINGRQRILRSLRVMATGPAPTTPGVAPLVRPPYGTNASVLAGRRFALVVDEESFVVGREQLLRQAIGGLMAQLTPADETALIVLPFGGVKVPFTFDAARIQRAMAGLSGQGSRSETGSELACRTRRFLDSLHGFLEGQAGAASPLTVVLFTAGMAAPRRDAPMSLGPGMCELLPDHFRVLTAAAVEARANFYVMKPADMTMPGPSSETIAGRNFLGSDNPLEGIEHLVGSTGGATLPLDASGTGSLLRVAKETSAFWIAELEPESGEIFGRSRTLDVRVNRRGVTVRARPGVTFPQPSRFAQTTRLAVPELLASREAFNDLQLHVGGFTVRDAKGQLRVGIVAEPVDPATKIDAVGAVLLDGDGRVAARWFASDTAARPIIGAMAVPEGTYRLRVAALDREGRSGVAEDVVEARLVPVGPLSLGSLMLGVARETGLAFQLEFSTEPTVIASFGIYGGAAGMGLSATLEVALSQDGPAVVTVPLALSRAGESSVTASGAVPLGALPARDYVVRGRIRLEDGTTGRVVRTLRKVAR